MADSTERMHPTICRQCVNQCAVLVEIADGKVLRLTGDRESPLYHGYSCSKGRSHPSLYDHPDRLLHPLKHVGNEFVAIPLEQAIAEISDKLGEILGRDGPSAVASYIGTAFFQDNSANASVMDAFMRAIGSPMSFNSGSIDQPGKPVARGLHGMWMAPGYGASTPRVALLIGINPFVSHSGPSGNPSDPIRDLHQRGGSLIVIDPRRTETAKRATLHLQPHPGHDVAILAAMIKVILAEGLQDSGFIAGNVSGIDDLERMVAPFDPEAVAQRAGIDADDLITAARLFASEQRGYAHAGTGPNMSGEGTLLEYLVLCIDSICGHWFRAGELIENALTSAPAHLQMACAQALSPFPSYGFGTRLRARGLAESLGGLSAAALADEIMLEGSGQVRALISAGGNPVTAWPDQLKTVQALKSLELLVHTDVQMSATARLAHYVIPVKLPFEMPGTTLSGDFLGVYANGLGFRQSHAQYTAALVPAPQGSEVIDHWALPYLCAQQLGIQLEVFPGYGSLTPGGVAVAIDMDEMPSNDELLELVHAGSRISLDEIKTHPHGAYFPDPPVYVQPKQEGWEGRLDVANPEMMHDLSDRARLAAVDDRYPFRLISRRMTHIVNSPTIAMPPNRKTYNPAFMHPADLAALQLADGDVVTIRSTRASVDAIVETDRTVRRGVISIAHCFGDVPGSEGDVSQLGASTARLTPNDDVFDRYTGQPRMSNVPVQVERRAAG